MGSIRREVTRFAALATATLIATGCAFHPDPTEANFYVKVVNDTSRTVILSICGTDDGLCTKTSETGRVTPDGTWPSVQTSVGSSNPVLVRSINGKRLGCLPLLFNYNASGGVVQVSERVPCAKNYAAQSKAD